MSLPRVSCIIMAWSPKQRQYLDLLIASLRFLDYPSDLLDIVIVAPRTYAKQLDYPDPNIRVRSPESEQFSAAQGYNFGFAQADPHATYLWQLNDDVCVTRDSLRQLVSTAESLDNKLSIVNGISPCDRGVTSILEFPVMVNGTEHMFDEQYARLDDVAHMLPELMNTRSTYPSGFIVMPWLCGYASLISRALYEKIGGTDENYVSGPDDIDYCFTATAAGGVCIMDLGAVIWHFGEVTKQQSPQSAEQWQRNLDYFKQKWGVLPPVLAAQKAPR